MLPSWEQHYPGWCWFACFRNWSHCPTPTQWQLTVAGEAAAQHLSPSQLLLGCSPPYGPPVPMGLFCKPTRQVLFGRVQKMGGGGLELSRELLPSACTDTSLFFSADIGQLPLAVQELRAVWLSQGRVVLLGFLDAKHQQGFVFYFVLTSCFKIKLSTITSTYCL